MDFYESKNRPRRKPGKQGPGPARRPAGGLTREETHGVRDVAERRHADAPGNPRQVQDLDGKKRSAGSAGDVAQDFELRSLCNVKRIFIKAEHTPTILQWNNYWVFKKQTAMQQTSRLLTNDKQTSGRTPTRPGFAQKQAEIAYTPIHPTC